MKKSTRVLRKLIEEGSKTPQSLERIVSELEQLLARKKKILDGISPAPWCGLCAVYGFPSIWREVVFKKWKHFSGDTSYPVFDEHNTGYETPYVQYEELPRYTGRYGRLRFKLAKHILKTLKRDLKTLKSLGVI